MATAATAATVPSHEEAVARGQMMAATASADAAEIRPFDRLPDDGLAKVLAVLKQSEHRRVEAVCQRWRQIRPRASTARVKSLRFRGSVVTIVARRFRNNQEDYYSTPLRFSNVGIGRKDLLILDGTGDDFVVSTLHTCARPPTLLRMHPGTGVCKPPNHRGLTEDRAQATHFEAVETLFPRPTRVLHAPGLRLLPPQGHAAELFKSTRVGADRRATSDAVTNGRRGRPNEGHAFKNDLPRSTW